MSDQKILFLVLIGVLVTGTFATINKSSKKPLWPIRFPVRLNDTGEIIYYNIEKLHPSKYEEAAVFAAKQLKLNTKTPKTCWRDVLEKNLSVVIFKPGTQQIIGINILDIRESTCRSHYVCDRIFDKFSIDKYLTCEALAVDPNYRRHGLGEALLRVQVTICLEQNIDVTASLFISNASNRLADRLNYTCLKRMSSHELAEIQENDPVRFGNTNEIACKYLAFNNIQRRKFCTIM